MFNNNVEDEADFCEAYKSQILNNGSREEKPSNTFSKILTILLLLIIIVAVSIYGYIYITNNINTSPPASVQVIDDDDLIVMDEDEEEPIGIMPPTVGELDIDKIAKDVKLAIEKGDDDKKVEKKEEKPKEKIEKPLKVPTGDAQSAYLEELAKLSEEIDKERK